MQVDNDNFSVTEIKARLTENHINMVYRGMLSQEILTLIGQQLKNSLSNRLVSKRLFAIAVEVCQNIHHYSSERSCSDKEQKEIGIGTIAFGKSESHHMIFSGNYIDKDLKKIIIERVNIINALSTNELRDFYLKQRKEPQIGNKPGANLGFIDVKRKSGNPLEIEFIHSNDQNRVFFILSVRVDKSIRMKNFFYKGSSFEPTIDFNAETGVLEIEGESYHEYTKEFFQPIFDWLKKYLLEPNRVVTLNFKMYYFNTSSARRFLEILTMLEEYQNTKDGRIRVNWYYEHNDIDMLESGEEYSEDVDLEFNLVPY